MLNNEFLERRKKLLEQLKSDEAVILFSSDEHIRNGDVHYPFRQNSNFFYFTGFLEPEAIAIFLPGRSQGEYILFNRPRNPEMERWTGTRAGQEGGKQKYGADQSFDINKADQLITDLLREKESIYYELGKQQCDGKVLKWVTQLQGISRKSQPCPAQLKDIASIVNEMRLFKSPSEIELMREAGKISATAHKKLMKVCKPGMYEYELQALFDYETQIRDCRNQAYPAIVGGGANACVLHYVQNQDKLEDGDLVLVDAGGEYQYYASDITRTYPVNGRFSESQSLIYDLVLKAQTTVIDSIKPGLPWNKLQEIGVEVLTEGLLALGILKGSFKQALETKAYQDYYMHTISHWLGLDVHDAGAYKKNGEWRELEPGMVLTIEPGLYLSASEKLNKKWWNIGVRIEDDVLVTENGCEVLTLDAPKTRIEIEAVMND